MYHSKIVEVIMRKGILAFLIYRIDFTVFVLLFDILA